MAEDLLAPSLPPAVMLAATLLLGALLLYQVWRANSLVASFVLCAVWLRYMMSAYHAVTFSASPLGLSWNALGSCAIFGAGLLVIDWRLLKLRFFLPVYVFVAVILLSGLVNHNFGGTINAIIKYGYFIVLACGMSEALAKVGEQRFLRLLIWAFAPLILLQILSVVLGVSKMTESDGSVSYIGGYNHEAAFSVALATCFVIVAAVKDINGLVKGALLVVTLVGLLLANYRTSIIAIVPSMFVQFAQGSTEIFHKRQRLLIGLSMALVCFIGIIAGSVLLEDRFRDLGTVFTSGTDLIKSPNLFSRADDKILSGRLAIWSEYLYGYAAGTDLQKLVGYGANSWEGVFTRYAHNTLVSQIYEGGALGVLALFYLWSSMFAAVMRIRRGPRTKLVAAHLSFLLISFATMPLWMIEGYIFYGLICGYTLFLLKSAPSLALDRPVAIPALAAARY